MTGYPDSYYAATAVGIQEHESLDDVLGADVCIIGGGFTGLSAALHLALHQKGPELPIAQYPQLCQ